MSILMELSGHEPRRHQADVCGREGAELLFGWFASLPPGAYPAVDAFASEFTWLGTDVLMEQMNDAAMAHGPPDEASSAVVERLLDLLGGGYPDETAVIELFT